MRSDFIENIGNKVPWYLKKTPFVIIAFCFSPLAFIIILLNRNRLDNETWGDRFFVATLLLLIFSIGLMPRSFLSLFLVIGVNVFIFVATIAVLKRRE